MITWPRDAGRFVELAGPKVRTRERRDATIRMWVVSGPFDGEVSNEVGFQSNAFSLLTIHQTHRYVPESKLLKSGKSYLIGRKSTCDLVVNHKKVSHDHGRFEVGGFSPDDVVRTTLLLFHPTRSLIYGYSPMSVTRRRCGS